MYMPNNPDSPLDGSWPVKDELTLNEYQEFTETTAVYRDKVESLEARQTYAILGAAGEAGELSNLWKKYFRDGDYDPEKIIDEAGDVLYYLARVAEEFGWTLEEVAQRNIDKLTKRMEDGTIHGHNRDGERS